MRGALRPAFIVGLAGIVLACAYPRRSASLAPVTGEASDPPADVWQLQIVSATLPERQRSGLPWDGDGPPDPYVRIFRGEDKLWESDPVEDTLTPSFNVTLPENVWLPPERELRIELWDDDGVSSDPIGIWTNHGLPDTALPGVDARVLLERNASIMFRVLEPKAYRGAGVLLYEVRDDALEVIDVLPLSPAGRAGLRRGDRIVAIDGRKVAKMGEARAASALSLAGMRESTLSVTRGGERHDVRLDGGYAWRVK